MANTIKSGFSIDTTSLKALVRDLEKTAPGIKKATTAALREAAAVVAAEAKALSSWSSRIPGSIKVAGSGARIVVRAGGAGAPHAAPFEHGGVPGEFRHPLFGNREKWYPQQARPFLTPALAHKEEELVQNVVRGIDTVFREARL